MVLAEISAQHFPHGSERSRRSVRSMPSNFAKRQGQLRS